MNDRWAFLKKRTEGPFGIGYAIREHAQMEKFLYNFRCLCVFLSYPE
jgi:hypothetical protein